ncbi:MAG: hypothetical protein WAO41_00290 [Candidatus Nanopelagicales bacterium]
MADPTPSPAGDRLLRVGGVVTLVGIAFTLVAMLPLVVTSIELPSAFWFLSMLTGVGLALILLGLFQASRARRRR